MRPQSQDLRFGKPPAAEVGIEPLAPGSNELLLELVARRRGVAVEPDGRNAPGHPEIILFLQGSKSPGQPLLVPGLFEDPVNHHAQERGLRTVEIPCPAAVGHVAETVNQIKHVLGIVFRQVEASVTHESFVGEIGIPIIELLKGLADTGNRVRTGQPDQRLRIDRIILHRRIPRRADKIAHPGNLPV